MLRTVSAVQRKCRAQCGGVPSTLALPRRNSTPSCKLLCLSHHRPCNESAALCAGRCSSSARPLLVVLFLVATWELLGIWGQPRLFSSLWWIQLDGNDSIQVGLWPPRCQHSLVLNWFALLLDSPLRPGCPWMLGGRNLWRYAIWSICLVELGHFLGSCYLI